MIMNSSRIPFSKKVYKSGFLPILYKHACYARQGPYLQLIFVSNTIKLLGIEKFTTSKNVRPCLFYSSQCNPVAKFWNSYKKTKHDYIIRKRILKPRKQIKIIFKKNYSMETVLITWQRNTRVFNWSLLLHVSHRRG